MFRFPFYGYPFNYSYYNYYKKNFNNCVKNENNEKNKENSITDFKKISNTINQFYDYDQPIFEIFDIKIYIDDLIILGLLFFLYQENVKDELLYIILLLLLFS